MKKDATHSLTAYRLNFSYMERNNPFKEEMKERIENNEKPKVEIGDLISEVVLESNSQAYLKTNGFAFKLSQLDRKETFDDGEKYVIIPNVGKSDLPFTVYKENGSGPYHYGAGSTSTYSHNIYIYEFADSCYMICHRRGRSGCKTVLSMIFNRILRNKGIKLETSVILPNRNDRLETYKPEKMILKYRSKESGDIADKLIKKEKTSKEIVVRELIVNLGVSNNSIINNLLNDRISRKITKEEAFVEIKRELNDKDYNDAEVVFKIGKVKRSIKWDNLEEVFEGKDITEELEKMGGAQENNISKCADAYIKEIRSLEK